MYKIRSFVLVAMALLLAAPLAMALRRTLGRINSTHTTPMRNAAAILLLSCSALAPRASAEPGDDYLEIVRRNGWAVLFSERLTRNMVNDPEIPQTCKVSVYEEFSPRQVEIFYVNFLKEYFQPNEAAAFVSFLRTSIGKRFGDRDFDYKPTEEEANVYASYEASPAARSFERFADQGMPRLAAMLESQIRFYARACYSKHYGLSGSKNAP